MLKILGENYYLDVDRIDDYIQIKPSGNKVSGETESVSISVIKFDTIKLLLEVIMDEEEMVDSQLGAKATENLSIPFKIAFNTLLYKKLLTKL